MGVTKVEDLLALDKEAKVSADNDRMVAFQVGVRVDEVGKDSLVMVPRTLEEAFAYEKL
ncbi:hypothetical protein QW180_30760 [Vibrio sinaloensis]|nr:hypothetical protein [Vibrio sinaloensis]